MQGLKIGEYQLGYILLYFPVLAIQPYDTFRPIMSQQKYSLN